MMRQPVIAGPDTTSRVYPTCGSFLSAELGQARVQFAIHPFAKGFVAMKMDPRVRLAGDAFMRWALAALFSALLSAHFAAPAKADPVADFYKGRTVALVVGSSTGGGYDTMARAIARFIGRHIPGNPTVVVRNMPGAGGITAMNYLFNTAERDGSVLALVQNNTPLEPLFGTKQARYDATRVTWLGTPSFEVAMVLLWHTVPVNSVDDLKHKETQVGASGANSTPAFYARLLNATLGTRMKIVNGYPGQNDALLAMERGELDGYPSVFESALTSTRPTWIADKVAKAIVQYGPERLTKLSGVPFAPDLVSNEEDKLLLQAAFAPLALGRPLAMPPEVPADRVAAIRKALADTFADPEFLAEGERMGLAVNAPRTGEQLADVIARAYQSPPQVVARLQKLDNP
jgi:tripartite-type tricarboxylate transporter receptor subunit TctC